MGRKSRRKQELRQSRAREEPGASDLIEIVDQPRGSVRPSRRARWRALSLILLHVAIGAHILHWWTQKTTLTPLEPSEVMQTFSQGLVNAGAILFGVSILSTAIFGRFFCGWGCHIIALQDLCSWLLGRIGIKPQPFRSRLLVFGPLVAAIFMFVLPTLIRLGVGDGLPDFRAHLYTDDLWARFPSWGVALFTLGVCGFGIVYLLGNKGFCTYACPYGGIYGLVEPLAPLRVRVDDNCNGCGHCTATCTSNVRVHEEVRLYQMVVDPGCMRCTDCISVCPKDALRMGWGRPSIGHPAPRAEPKPLRPSYSWPEEIALAVLFLVSVAVLRSLYDIVPMLLALALGAISAHLLVTGWRLRSQPHVSYGRHPLKRAGEHTSAGRFFGAVVIAWSVFLVHSAVIQYLTLTGAASVNSGIAAHEQAKANDLPSDLRGVATGVERLVLADRYGIIGMGNARGLIASGYATLDRDDDAEVWFRRAVDISPDYAFAHLALARYAELRGDDAARVRLLEAALDADPELPNAHESLVRALSDLGRETEAVTALEVLLAERPSSAAIRTTYGMLLASLGDAEAGIRETVRVVDAHPDNAAALYNLALLYANQSRFTEAVSVCAQLRPLLPEAQEIAVLCSRIDDAAKADRAPAPSGG